VSVILIIKPSLSFGNLLTHSTPLLISHPKSEGVNPSAGLEIVGVFVGVGVGVGVNV
jgi:hypothetical protein